MKRLVRFSASGAVQFKFIKVARPNVSHLKISWEFRASDDSKSKIIDFSLAVATALRTIFLNVKGDEKKAEWTSAFRHKVEAQKNSGQAFDENRRAEMK